MNISDVPKLIKSPNANEHVSLHGISSWITRQKADYGVDLNPDFQRTHVWSLNTKIKFIEYIYFVEVKYQLFVGIVLLMQIYRLLIMTKH